MVKELNLSELEQLEGGDSSCLQAFMASSAIFAASSTALFTYYNTGEEKYLNDSAGLMAAFLISIPVVDDICSR